VSQQLHRRAPFQIHAAVIDGDIEKTRALMSSGHDVNDYDFGRGQRPLHLAVRTDNADMVNFLLDQGAKIEEKNGAGFTPLQEAGLHGCMNGFTALLDRGAIWDPTSEKSAMARAFTPDPDAIDTLLRRAELKQIAQAALPQSDLASPDECLARRSRGRAM
jgi:ankyrin repeat protein